MEQILRWCADNWAAVAVALSLVIQVTPIKCNPWQWIGKFLTADISKELEAVKKTIYNNEIDRIRYEVLDFANSCRNERRHTRDEFEHIVDLNKKYKKLLELTKTENGVFDAEYDYIKELYAERLRKNDFL